MSEDAPRRFLDLATQLSISTSPQIISNTTSSLEANHLYSFSIQGHSSFHLALDGLSANSDVKLIQDKNKNGEFDKGETIAYSKNGGKLAESISTNLVGGTYHIQVSFYSDIETDYRLIAWAVPFDNEDTVNSQTKSISDSVAQIDSGDYFRFNFDSNSNKSVLDDITADLRLLSGNGNILASSLNIGSLSEAIDGAKAQTFPGGTYYNLESPSPLPEIITTSVSNPTENSGAKNGSSPIVAASPAQNTDNARIQEGTLRADTFTLQPDDSRIVISGNGNVDYGTGARDLLDLSEFVSTSVTFNYADNTNGGVAYNLGDNIRIFDALSLGNGREILFEGIESIKFSDTTIDLSQTTNDPLFNQQWNLHGMGVHNAWRFTQGSKNVMIGVQDTGLATDTSGNIHPDLRETNFIGENYIDESDNFSHGTEVHGTIAAKSNNEIGGAGINWISDLILVDVVGDHPLDYNLANATQGMIDKAKEQDNRLVVNMSLAGGLSAQFEQLIANNQDNALFVIASGNQDKNTIASPADLAEKYDNVVAVGASWGTTDYFGNSQTPGERISYENWWGSNFGKGLTVMAPSEHISTSATRKDKGTYNFEYKDNFNGTSASTANVSGVASLIWSVNSNLSALQIKEIISETAYDLGNKGYDEVYGNGFINADAAVRRALAIARDFA